MLKLGQVQYIHQIQVVHQFVPVVLAYSSATFQEPLFSLHHQLCKREYRLEAMVFPLPLPKPICCLHLSLKLLKSLNNLTRNNCYGSTQRIDSACALTLLWITNEHLLLRVLFNDISIVTEDKKYLYRLPFFSHQIPQHMYVNNLNRAIVAKSFLR